MSQKCLKPPNSSEKNKKKKCRNSRWRKKNEFLVNFKTNNTPSQEDLYFCNLFLVLLHYISCEKDSIFSCYKIFNGARYHYFCQKRRGQIIQPVSSGYGNNSNHQNDRKKPNPVGI